MRRALVSTYAVSLAGRTLLYGPLKVKVDSFATLFCELSPTQGAKKVVSDSPGLVDFAIGLVNSVLNLPDGQVKIFRRIKITKVL